jgi:hypothetical protein
MTGSQPPSNSTGVPTDVIVDIGLSDVPYPPDLEHSWGMAVASTRVTGLATADLVDRRVRVRAARGLLAHTQYIVTLSTNLHSFAGKPLQNAAQVKFVTGAGPAGGGTAPTLITLRGDVLPVLTESGCANCHSNAQGPAAAGLELDTPEGVLAAIGKAPALPGAPPLITRGSHPQSYLMWKALGLPHTAGHQAPDGIALPHDPARTLADWIDQGAQDN